MIFRRVLLALVAAATFAAAAGVIVVALGFALFALVQPYLGEAGAAAIVALAAAVLIGLLGLIMALAGRPKRPKPTSAVSRGVVERAMVFVKEKPIVSGAVAIGVGLIAVRNPKYLGEAVRAFIEGGAHTK